MLHETMGIMYAAIHSHATRRTVQVRCITGKQNTPVTKRFKATLLQRVVVALQQRVRLIAGENRLQL